MSAISRPTSTLSSHLCPVGINQRSVLFSCFCWVLVFPSQSLCSLTQHFSGKDRALPNASPILPAPTHTSPPGWREPGILPCVAYVNRSIVSIKSKCGSLSFRKIPVFPPAMIPSLLFFNQLYLNNSDSAPYSIIYTFT